MTEWIVFGDCGDCGSKRRLRASGLCRRCHRRRHPFEPMVLECVCCAQRKLPDGYELCYPCYKRAYKFREGVCSECGRVAQGIMKELCPRCYERKNPHSKKMIECASCGEMKPHHGRGLCTACYQRVYKRPKSVCSECGRTMRMATKELCPACYYRKKPRSTKIIECASCGEMKQHAAHGLCLGCYNRSRQSYMEHQQKLSNKRCETCDRLLRIVRSRVDMRTRFCDGFCRGHNPERNAKLNIKRMHEATAAELQRRKDEALSQTDSAAA